MKIRLLHMVSVLLTCIGYITDLFPVPADSLAHKGSTVPRFVKQKVQWWAWKRFGRDYKDVGDILEHGAQDNVVSCGIFTANTIAHLVLGDNLMSSTTGGVERARWFNRLAAQHFVSDFLCCIYCDIMTYLSEGSYSTGYRRIMWEPHCAQGSYWDGGPLDGSREPGIQDLAGAPL